MLRTNLAGVELRNPLILAAGILGTSGSILKKAYDSGAGAVTAKSIGPKEWKGNQNPVIVEYERGLLNCVGLSCLPPEEAEEELTGLKMPLIVSIYGKGVQDYVNLAKRFSKVASILELNVSCPNVEGKMLGKDAGSVKKIASRVKKVSKAPVFMKLSPNVDDIVPIAKAAEKGGADGITAINAAGPGMVIDIDMKRPVLSFRKGGVSGPGIRPIAVRCVYEIYENVKIPIIGTGGVTNWKDAIEMILAGAAGVGIGTAVMYRDLKVFGEIKRGMESYLRKNKTTLGKIRGLAHEQA